MRHESTFPEFPGYIETPDGGLMWPQLLAFGKARAENTPEPGKSISHLEMCQNAHAAINGIVTWHIDGLPEKPGPADIYVGKETLKANAFFLWVYQIAEKAWLNEKAVPKVPSSPLIATPVTQKE